jgi:hypothetical protein
MRYFILILATAMLLPSTAVAVSETIAPWLLFSMGARASGMGGAHITEATGADGVYWNPANLGLLRGRSITGMHFAPVPDLADDVYFEYASYAEQSQDWGGIGGNIMFITYGESEHTDIDGLRLGTFSSWEMAVGLGWGTAISQRFAVGAGIKVLLSYLSPELSTPQGTLEEGQGKSWAVDFGVFGHNLGPMGLRWGLALSNLGPALKFADNLNPNPLPLNIRTGLGFDPYRTDVHRVTIAIDMNKVLARPREEGGRTEYDPAWKAIVTAWTDDGIGKEFEDAIYNAGVEYSFSEFVFLRTGWVHDKTGDITDYTYGIGVAYRQFRFDFAGYPQATGLDDVKRFSITYDF